jgi:hypothetical protein
VVPTSFVGVNSFDKTRFRFISGHLPISLQEKETGGMSDDLLITVRSHEDHGTKLTSVISKFMS